MAERIIVGVDGSESGQRALVWALAHAAAGDTLVVTHIWTVPEVFGIDLTLSKPGDFEAAAKRLVKEAIADIKIPEGVKIETNVRLGQAGHVLSSISGDCDLIIMGSRGYGGFPGLLVGSSSTYVIHHSKCPVVVVPHKEPAIA